MSVATTSITKSPTSTDASTTRRLSATAALLVVAALALTTLFMQAPSADATEIRKAPLMEQVERGPGGMAILDSVHGADSCPDNALGVPGACYVYVNHLKNGDCPSDSVVDGEGKCRKPISDNADLCIDNWGYLFPPGCRFTSLG